MFAVRFRKKIVIRVLLIGVIISTALASSTATAQANGKSISISSPDIQEAVQGRSFSTVQQLSEGIRHSVVNGRTADTEFGTSTVFIENVGQFDPRVRFQSHGGGATIYFSEGAIWFTLLEPPTENSTEKHLMEKAKVVHEENQKSRKVVNLKVNLIGSNPHPTIESFEKIATSFSYFTGSDPSNWYSEVPAWGGIRYVEIYPGIDLEIASEGDYLIWNFLVTDSSRLYDKNNPVSNQGIRIKIAGHQKLQSQNNGNGIDITTDVGTLALPVIRLDGEESIPQLDKNGEIIVLIPSRTSLSMFRSVSYTIPKETGKNASAPSQPGSPMQTASNMPLLAPEDLLLYSTFLGGSVNDIGEKFVVDQNEMVYIAGFSYSPDFPVTPGAYDTDNLNHDGFVAKIDITNSQIVYATHLGGWADPQDLAVDSNGNVYVTGNTQDLNFPTTLGVFGSTREYGTTGFVSKLSASGNQLLYSTFLGGSTSCCNDTTTYPYAIAVDNDGFVYIAGSTLDDVSFAQTTVGYDLTHNGDWDAFITKINPTFTQQVYFTYLGGSGDDFNYTRSLLLDESGSVYIVGDTTSSDFPTTPGAYNISSPSSFVLKLNPSGESLGFSTFLGGVPGGITMDSSGSLYIALNDVVASSMPITNVIDQDTEPWGTLVVKLDPTASTLEFSTHITDYGDITGIALDPQGYIYVVGNTVEYDVQTSLASYSPLGGYDPDCQTTITYTCYDIFIQKLTPTGDQLLYGSYFGGSSVDGSRNVVADDNGNILFLADTSSADFPTTPDAIDNTLGSNNWSQGDVAIVKMSTNIPIYDCSGTTVSPVAQAVLDEVDSQEYCGNHYENSTGLIILPPGEAAFERFRDLAKDAQYEVDFSTMLWDENGVDPGDSPGRIFLQGIKTLYDQVQSPESFGKPADYYSNGVRVRILIGLRTNPLDPLEWIGLPLPWPDLPYEDQHGRVLEDLYDLNIPLAAPNWNLEVALYDAASTTTYSHVKVMIVDGKTVVTGGYNLQYIYLNGSSRRDLGVQISGPIAFRALSVFDNLWANALTCQGINEYGKCLDSTASLQRHPAITTPIPEGDDIVFSLFRDNTDKTADSAIVAAINAASSDVNIIQDRFINNYYLPAPYARAILDTIEKDGLQVQVKLIVSGVPETKKANTKGICNLVKRLLKEDPSLSQYFEARMSRFAVHSKALSVDNSFVIIGSQNFDGSAWGDFDGDLDLAEYNLAIDSSSGTNSASSEFDSNFDYEWFNTDPVFCRGNSSQSLQLDIDQAPSGSIIFIPEGVYKESVTINKPLTLIGADANQTIMQPQDNQAAFRVTSSDVLISNMKISGGDGYGIELVDSSPSSLKNIQINRVVFENNAQGGVLAQGLISGSPMNYAVENSTFIGGASGVVIDMVEPQSETSVVRDNIFWGQSGAPVHILSSDDSHVEYSYNLFYDCGLGDCATNWVQGSISAISNAHDNLFDLDPLFASLENGAYQLSVDSPAIDAGTPDLLHDFFFDGDDDGFIRIDIGAFEYVPVTNVAPIVNAGNEQTITLGDDVAVNATYSDADNTEDHSARIDWGDGTVEDVAVNMTGPGTGDVAGQHTYAGAGTYTVEVCVTDIYGAVGCDTVTIVVNNAFPLTSILDNFNRANGSIGSNWYGNTAGYNISANQLLVKSKNANLDIYWNTASFGPDQEAYFTFSSLSTTSVDQDLILKSQYVYGWAYGLIDVQYEASANRVVVWTYDHNQSWVQYGADIPVTFVNGDQFGARALSNGTLEVYRNGVLIATRDISAWPYNASGGYIGLWFGNAKDARIDDFGGGNIPQP